MASKPPIISIRCSIPVAGRPQRPATAATSSLEQQGSNQTLATEFWTQDIVFRTFLSYIDTVTNDPQNKGAPDIRWNFLSNYAHVLVCLAQNPDARLRDVAERVGITERTTLRLVTQLEKSGILMRQKEGRRNRYIINPGERLRHPIEEHCTVGELLATILGRNAIKALIQRFKDEKRLALKRVP